MRRRIGYFSMDTASAMVFSGTSRPYLSTSVLLFSPWVRHPAPPDRLFQHGHGIGNGLFQRFAAVFVHIRFALLAVGQTSGTAG